MRALACPDCDLLQVLPDVPPGARARCARCGCLLATGTSDPLERPLALGVTAAIVLIVANVAPLMELSAVGRHASTTILGGAYEMWLEGQTAAAVLVAFCTSLAPATYLVLLIAILLGASRPQAPAWVGALLRWIDTFQSWSMVEVMMLGILVALIKIAQLAAVAPGVGLYAVGALMLLFPAIQTTLDLDSVWDRVAWASGAASRPAESPHPSDQPP